MHPRRFFWPVAFLAMAFVACSGDTTSSADVGVDGEVGVDLSVDAASPDLAPDFSVSPCGEGASIVETWGRTMVICEDKLSPHNLCMADILCNGAAGWSLCAASQYQTRSKNHGSKVKAWMKGCVRDSNDPPTAPLDSSCVCKRLIGTEAYDVDWSCTGAPLHKGVKQHHIGLVTNDICHRVGINIEATESYWVTQASYTNLPAVVCCR
ncbi:MAG: hypothetical protein KAI47_25445 [Deltaproteobacteria bacterium]|nr:hypothetical protein [Deltaproteobacteria bacterium]